METEKDNKLAFLDSADLREPDGRLAISVYRKPTHTDQYLAFDSHHPHSVKRETYQDWKTKQQYRTRQRVQSYYGFTLCQRSVRTASPLPTTTRRMRCFQVRNYNKISVSTTKSAVDPAKQDGVVYRIPCECGKMYIGETGRPMQDRIKEHDRHIRLARIETSAVSEHAHYTGHKPL
ncbi:uncharacterized protein [Pocillopora verrucosa]|uniref:uncharacterized protein n=1 Tax=Pocillopora verrucosa TaxID=203993 RepID=UPI00333E373A